MVGKVPSDFKDSKSAYQGVRIDIKDNTTKQITEGKLKAWKTIKMKNLITISVITGNW